MKCVVAAVNGKIHHRGPPHPDDQRVAIAILSQKAAVEKRLLLSVWAVARDGLMVHTSGRWVLEQQRWRAADASRGINGASLDRLDSLIGRLP
jgi:hypothetical protein